MASLQPACHTKKFSNDYYLSVTVEYDGCVCCVDLPDARMPMTIVPLVNPDLLNLQVPDDFEPGDLGMVEFDLSRDPSSSD